MNINTYDESVFTKRTGPLSASELQWIYSGGGGGVGDEATGPRVEKVRKVFSRMEGHKKILDIGCSNGAILKPFLKQHEVHGVDISECLVKKACEFGVKAKIHDLMQGPLPYADESFDAIFCGETIEHQIDTDWLMLESNRVLKKGGQLVLTFPNIRTPLGIAMMIFFDLPPMFSARYRASHLRDFTLRTIKIVLSKHGFRHDKSYGSAFYLPKIGEFWIHLASLLPSWSYTVVTVATKMDNSKYSPADYKTESKLY